MNYDSFYDQAGFYYGISPSPSLMQCIIAFNVKPCIAVDIGAGEGRNSIYLAQNGFTVIAIEPNLYGSRKICDYANQHNIRITVKPTVFSDGIIGTKNVGLFVASTVLSQMTQTEISKAINEIYDRLQYGGYVYVCDFTEKDPGFGSHNSSYVSECSNTVEHYFKEGELKQLFNRFDVIENKELFIKDDTHGPIHYHSLELLFARKPFKGDSHVL